MLKYPIHKSDIPSNYKPSVVDEDFEDAAFSCVNAIPGEGVIYNTLNSSTRTIISGPVTIIRNYANANARAVMFCTLGMVKHFVQMYLTTTPDRQELEKFTVHCNFDEIAIDQDEEVSTHWIVITTGESQSSLMKNYTDMVTDEHKIVPLKKPSLTVYSSWHFYSFEFCQQYLDDELKDISDKNVPIDVVQIDDGWMDYLGVYDANLEKYPKGMQYAAERIKEAGYIPGIWVAPFVIETGSSVLDKYPDIIQRDKDQKPLIYNTAIRDCYVLDPTASGAREFLYELFSKLKKWGFTYYKLDWIRAIYDFDVVRFRDAKVNRTLAYDMGLSYIREILGKECYILGCGGLSDPANLNIIDGQRTSKDVRGMWHGPESMPKSGAIVQIKQNLLRNYVHRHPIVSLPSR